MERFEDLLLRHKAPIERYVRYRIHTNDAEDLLQEIYITAYEKFATLRRPDCFKAWLLSIARNACKDYFRRQANIKEIPLSDRIERIRHRASHGLTEKSLVADTLSYLSEKDREILYLSFWAELPQTEIAARLGIPLGTVKSRLHTAKKHFIKAYPPLPITKKGEESMKALPKILPEYTLTLSDKAPFPVCFEEMMGWFIIPRPGEKNRWGSYDMPARRLTEECVSHVTGKAILHGIEGVEIQSRTAGEENDHFYILQLTETHCRMLGERYCKKGILHYSTFLDGEDFLTDWGFGEDNCGHEIHLVPKGDIEKNGNTVTAREKEYLLDIVGRYSVTLAERSYDTVCLMGITDGVMTEQYLDAHGRTVLWRRFNADDWGLHRFANGKSWSEQLPENEKITVNGKTYVHWYDSISDYIL